MSETLHLVSETLSRLQKSGAPGTRQDVGPELAKMREQNERLMKEQRQLQDVQPPSLS